MKSLKKLPRPPPKPGAPASAAPFPTDAALEAKRQFRFQLFITGHTPRSTEAVANLRALCEEHLEGRYDLEVIDLYQEPARATGHQIIASPTLIKLLPRPLVRMVGNLADREQLRRKLNLPGPAGDGGCPTVIPSA